MYVSLTGTPGTGKTDVASLLLKKHIDIIDLYQVAYEHDFFIGIDNDRNSKILDMKAINKYFKANQKKEHLSLIEGHASHLLPIVKKVILLRCHPKMLTKRLQKKRWSDKKIQENVEAETLDVILCELVERFDEQDLFEIDTTNYTQHEVANVISEIIAHDFKPVKKYKIGQIDWSEEILNGN